MEDTGDYFSLQWNNFRSSLTEGFHDFLQEEAMVDVTLAAEGKFLRAHKLVLSVCSPYFKNLFKVNPCKHPIVILKDVGHNELSYMLEFMYKGEVGVKHEDLPSFLKLADTLNVKGLAGEKILNDNHPQNNLNSNIARVRKKINKSGVSDINKENSEFQSCSEQLDKAVKNKKRKFPCKSRTGKKLKSEKFDDNNSVNASEGKSGDDVCEDKDSSPLIKFVRSDNVKSSGSLKQSESQCDNEDESHCDNKTSFSVWNDDIPDSSDSGAQGSGSFIQSDYSEEAEQTPQGGVDYQMIQTKRGKDMLLFGGYTFTQNRMCKDGMRWQCSYPRCKAFCRMSSAGWLTPFKTHHDHPKPSEREIKRRILRMELKARAQSSGATPGEIIRNALPAEEFHSADRACFTRCIQRFRRALQRKNSKAQEEVWHTPMEGIESEKEALKPEPANGEPSWLENPRPFLPSDPIKTDEWHGHQDSTVEQQELLDGKDGLQGKIEPYGM